MKRHSTTQKSVGEARHHGSVSEGTLHRPATPADDSNVPAIEPEPKACEVLRPAEATPGGIDNIPVEALPENARAAEELDYGRLDQDADATRPE